MLKPRFLVHGADLERIRFQQKPFTLDGNGLGLLRSEIATYRPRLVIIDALIAYMDASVDLHRANDTMQFMNELDQLAREFDTTMLIVRHLRKGDSGDALYRGLGSIGIAARARSIMLLGRHPEEPDVRISYTGFHPDASTHAPCTSTMFLTGSALEGGAAETRESAATRAKNALNFVMLPQTPMCQPRMKLSRSGLMTSAWVVSMPCG